MSESALSGRGARQAALSIVDIERACVDAGTAGEWDGPPARDAAVLGGAFGMHRFPDGMDVHVTDGQEMADVTAAFTLEPAVTIFLLLDGYVAFAVDGAPAELGADEEANVHCGLVWSRTRPARVERHLRRGRRVAKTAITLRPDWFDGLGAPPPPGFAAFRRRHGAQAQWAPSERAVRAAREILRPLETEPLLRRLAIKTRALTIVEEALGLFDARRPAPAAVPGAAQAARARAFLDETLDQPLTLPEAARALGMSVTVLQTCFRDSFGQTIGEYRRRQRLARANAALRDDDVSVAAAARRAGYSSAANFATAFRREFGYPPSQARA